MNAYFASRLRRRRFASRLLRRCFANHLLRRLWAMEENVISMFMFYENAIHINKEFQIFGHHSTDNSFWSKWFLCSAKWICAWNVRGQSYLAHGAPIIADLRALRINDRSFSKTCTNNRISHMHTTQRLVHLYTFTAFNWCSLFQLFNKLIFISPDCQPPPPPPPPPPKKPPDAIATHASAHTNTCKNNNKKNRMFIPFLMHWSLIQQKLHTKFSTWWTKFKFSLFFFF